MTPGKRTFDLGLALVLLMFLWPLVLIVALAVLLCDGRPVLYISERMQTPDRGFNLLKFRTMHPVAADSGVSGGDKATRITSCGRILRRWRLDELPQLWNILRGDISFVGPRPPLRQYVEAHPALYARVLRSRPGLTGLATVEFHRREAALLAACRTARDCDRVYARRCIPAKARLDLIYQQNRSLRLDLLLLLRTLSPRVPLRRRYRNDKTIRVS